MLENSTVALLYGTGVITEAGGTLANKEGDLIKVTVEEIHWWECTI